MYWKIKTSLLEKTLIDGLDNTDDSTIDEKLFLSDINNQTQENKPSNENSSVWGEHLNKPITEKQKVVKPTENSVSVKFSKKLFDGCDFKKRNPRKSIVKKKSSGLDSSQNVACGITSITSNDIKVDSNTQEDSAFHDDSNLSNIAVDSDTSMKETTKLSNISNYVPQSLSILQKSSCTFEHFPKMISANKKFDEGWLERCNENNSEISIVNIDPPVIKTATEIESDTDIVYESDNETQDIPLYSSQRIKAQEVSCEYDGQSIINQETNVSDNDISRNSKKRYNSDGDFEENFRQTKVPKSYDYDNIQSSTKDNRKKVVLEAKVSSGKANENFVRLDMKRKIYSRGKKSVKTTTYKKKQWKNRKKELGENYTVSNRTSLLKCFKCGDIGHYSRNCLKGMYWINVKIMIF